MAFNISRRQALRSIGALVGSASLAGSSQIVDQNTPPIVGERLRPEQDRYREYFWDFGPPWPDWPRSPDGVWQVAGPWNGTGGTFFHPDNADIVGNYAGEDTGYLTLSVQGTGPDGNAEGAEVEAVSDDDEDGFADDYSYGYYEARMRVPTGPGVYSFYWIARGGEGEYGPAEIDIEFVTAGTLGNADRWGDGQGYVWFALHPNDRLHEHALGFNPAADFHRYGFLWTPGQVIWTVDGHPVYSDAEIPSELSGESTETNSSSAFDQGTIALNAWVGNENWGGKTPPSKNRTVAYDYIWVIPKATKIPKTGPRNWGVEKYRNSLIWQSNC